MQLNRGGVPATLSLIVPSATLVGTDIQNEFGPIPPVLIPLFGKVALQKVIEKFSKYDPQTFVGLSDQKEQVYQYIDFFACRRVHLVDVSPSVSISETVEHILDSNPAILSGPMVINFADTIVNDLDLSLVGSDFIAYSITEETERWTLFKESGGTIEQVSDKQFHLDTAGWKTFVGLWGVGDPRRFYEILQGQNRLDKRTAFYNAITEYYNSASEVHFVHSRDWFDLGHIDNYYRARKQNINTRFFNTTNVNENGCGILKTSTNKSKIVQEITWYLNLPKDLRYHVPTLYEYSLDADHPFYEMEYYSYPSLDDCFVSGRFDLDTWNKVFSKIFQVIRRSAAYSLKGDDLRLDLSTMYREKTLTRLHKFLKDADPDLTGELDALIINGREIIPMTELLSGFDDLLERFHLFETSEFQLIHGDLCFGNILFDHKNGIIKFIDPRGEFGRHQIYGDVYYDLGKLSHSVLGHYDSIIFNQYRLTRIEKGRYSLTFFLPDYKETVGTIFTKYLVDNHYDIQKVRFIESLHFLSMLPLHADTPDRQKALLFRGLEIISGLVEDTR